MGEFSPVCVSARPHCHAVARHGLSVCATPWRPRAVIHRRLRFRQGYIWCLAQCLAVSRFLGMSPGDRRPIKGLRGALDKTNAHSVVTGSQDTTAAGATRGRPMAMPSYLLGLWSTRGILDVWVSRQGAFAQPSHFLVWSHAPRVTRISGIGVDPKTRRPDCIRDQDGRHARDCEVRK